MNLAGIGGVWPAALTPFRPDGAIDEPVLERHFRHLAETRGVKAIVVNGHAGEVTSLDRDERFHVVEVARRMVGERIGVVAGIVAENPRLAGELARDAERAGADAALLFPPNLFALGARLRPEMSVRFAGDVAEASGLPIVLFQLSNASGLGYASETIARVCAELPAVIAVKEGSDSPAAYEETLRALRALKRPVTVLTTNNSWLLASLAVGGDGILSGMGSIAAALQADLWDAVTAGDWGAARRAGERLFPLVQAFYKPPLLDMHNRMKAGLHHLGLLPHPTVRPPLLPLQTAEIESIVSALAKAGLEPRRRAAE